MVQLIQAAILIAELGCLAATAPPAMKQGLAPPPISPPDLSAKKPGPNAPMARGGPPPPPSGGLAKPTPYSAKKTAGTTTPATKPAPKPINASSPAAAFSITDITAQAGNLRPTAKIPPPAKSTSDGGFDLSQISQKAGGLRKTGIILSSMEPKNEGSTETFDFRDKLRPVKDTSPQSKTLVDGPAPTVTPSTGSKTETTPSPTAAKTETTATVAEAVDTAVNAEVAQTIAAKTETSPPVPPAMNPSIEGPRVKFNTDALIKQGSKLRSVKTTPPPVKQRELPPQESSSILDSLHTGQAAALVDKAKEHAEKTGTRKKSESEDEGGWDDEDQEYNQKLEQEKLQAKQPVTAKRPSFRQQRNEPKPNTAQHAHSPAQGATRPLPQPNQKPHHAPQPIQQPTQQPQHAPQPASKHQPAALPTIAFEPAANKENVKPNLNASRNRSKSKANLSASRKSKKIVTISEEDSSWDESEQSDDTTNRFNFLKQLVTKIHQEKNAELEAKERAELEAKESAAADADAGAAAKETSNRRLSMLRKVSTNNLQVNCAEHHVSEQPATHDLTHSKKNRSRKSSLSNGEHAPALGSDLSKSKKKPCKTLSTRPSRVLKAPESSVGNPLSPRNKDGGLGASGKKTDHSRRHTVASQGSRQAALNAVARIKDDVENVKSLASSEKSLHQTRRARNARSSKPSPTAIANARATLQATPKAPQAEDMSVTVQQLDTSQEYVGYEDDDTDSNEGKDYGSGSSSESDDLNNENNNPDVDAEAELDEMLESLTNPQPKSRRPRSRVVVAADRLPNIPRLAIPNQISEAAEDNDSEASDGESSEISEASEDGDFINETEQDEDQTETGQDEDDQYESEETEQNEDEEDEASDVEPEVEPEGSMFGSYSACEDIMNIDTDVVKSQLSVKIEREAEKMEPAKKETRVRRNRRQRKRRAANRHISTHISYSASKSYHHHGHKSHKKAFRHYSLISTDDELVGLHALQPVAAMAASMKPAPKAIAMNVDVEAKLERTSAHENGAACATRGTATITALAAISLFALLF